MRYALFFFLSQIGHKDQGVGNSLYWPKWQEKALWVIASEKVQLDNIYQYL